MTKLDERGAARRRLELPLGLSIDLDPAWTIALPAEVRHERVAESIGAVAERGTGVRGAREEGGPGTNPQLLAAGVYTDGPVPTLLSGPNWARIAVGATGLRGRTLHMGEAMLLRDDVVAGVRTARLMVAGRPGVGVLLAAAPARSLPVDAPFAAEPPGVERWSRDGVALARSRCERGGGITVAVLDRWDGDGEVRQLVRLAAWSADPDEAPGWDAVLALLDGADADGVERLVAAHRATWAERWARCGVEVDGDPVAERAARFAVFHLLTTAPTEGEAAVGPRGVTGPAYGGHVFWDADVFVQPALAALEPAAARAMVEYRIRRVPAAREIAAALGFDGARFPWESAGDGTDVTPRSVDAGAGVTFTVTTGEDEEHIVADVAWAADHLSRWTGDADVLTGSARELVLDTARYWASRVEVDEDGRGHLRGVMGPDEYHPLVDDDAFTNVMARWNLRRGASLLDELGEGHETATAWRRIADALVDGWDVERGTHEQFRGYWDLEPLVADIAPRPYAADMLLGPERVAGSQLIKQPDVLMLHHMVPEELPPDSLGAAIATYEPRTTHGSSLSPGVVAGLLARAGRPDDALEPFDVAARIDLDDLTGTAAGGLHLATMGALWQALAGGFAGIRPEGEVLAVDPSLPGRWASLTVRVRFRGVQLVVTASADEVEVGCDRPVRVRVGAGVPMLCSPPGGRFPLGGPREEVPA